MSIGVKRKLVTPVYIASTLSSAVLLATAALPKVTLAASTCGKDKDAVSTFFDWGCKGSDGSGMIESILTSALTWAAAGVSVVVLLGIVYGAIKYASSSGDESKAKEAIGIIRNSIIALVLYFAMYAILNFLIPGKVG